MDELLKRLEGARDRLEAKNRSRDRMLNEKRGITTKARTVITNVHQHDPENARRTYNALLEEVDGTRKRLGEHPDLWASGALRNALTEVAEAWAVMNLVDEAVPFPSEQVTDEALVLGVGDAIGEAHRLALDAIIDDRLKDATRRLEQMETLLEELILLDVSGGLVDHRRKADVGRRLVDQTRGKIALASIETRIEDRFRTLEDDTGENKEEA